MILVGYVVNGYVRSTTWVEKDGQVALLAKNKQSGFVVLIDASIELDFNF